METQKLKIGGLLRADDQSIICTFPSPRLVLSTSLYNGGYLLADAVFNHRLSLFVDSEQDLPGGSLENYLALTAKEQGLDPKRSTGLLTSARMHCRGYSFISYKDIAVEAVATAGVDSNAARAGDPACYYEESGKYHPLGGTINILIFTNVSLSHGAMAKALLGITEAKAAALQELAVVSPFTLHPATGTGTDGVILACDPTSHKICTDAGTQSKLGELLCRAAKSVIKQALAKECYIEPERQGNVLERMKRLDIAPNGKLFPVQETAQAKLLLGICQSIWQEYCWGLLTTAEWNHFLSLLETPALQPWGANLSKALRQKEAASLNQEHIEPLGGIR